MNGKEFYEYFRDALKHLGLSWGEMEKMQVYCSGRDLIFTHGLRSVHIHLQGGPND